MLASLLLIGLSLFLQGPVSGAGAPTGLVAVEGESGGLPSRLFGVEEPPTEAFAAEAEALFRSRTWETRPRASWRLDGEAFVPVAAQDLTAAGTSLSFELIRRGLARGHFSCEDGEVGAGEVAVALDAARIAQDAGAGLFAKLPKPKPMAFPLAGVALPMHYKQDKLGDYGWELREIKDLGAEWVNLLVVTQQERVDSSRVPLATERTPSDARIVATIRLARRLGLRVQLMPIVLLREAGPKDWRGTLAPQDPSNWWRSYDRFICHMADLAGEGGADVFSVGSEFASLEKHEAPWRRIILNVRLRYAGHLTYSANWDHFASVPFWDAVDFASMTAYFTLCPKVESEGKSSEGAIPAPFLDLEACVESGWQAGLDELVRLAKISKKPAVFSEVGVPSVQGALAGPWDYTLDAGPDPAAQALAFRVFQDVFLPGGMPAKHFSGGFLYDYWGLGGLEDKSYTPRGKPAASEWREILRGLGG